MLDINFALVLIRIKTFGIVLDNNFTVVVIRRKTFVIVLDDNFTEAPGHWALGIGH